MRIILFCILCLLSLPLLAAEALSMAEFGTLPIAHAGRVKPLSAFARDQLELFSGTDEWQKKEATHWLATMIFTPDVLEKSPLLLIKSQPLRETLGLPPQAGNLYALQTLRHAMQEHIDEILQAILLMEKKQPATKLQEDLAELYAKIGHFQQLQESFSFALPFPADKAETLDSLSRAEHKKYKALIDQMQERGRLSTAFAILPTQWKGRQDWYSPWSLRFNGLGSPQLAAYQNTWLKLAEAYRQGDATAWNRQISKAHTQIEQLGTAKYSSLKIQLEEWYYKLSFLSLAVLCYLTFAAAALLFQYRKITLLPLLAGIGFHGLALLVRMLILGRPPVSNLYESVLFVSLLIAISGVVIAYKERKNIIAVAAAIFAAGLLLLSQTLLAGQEHLPVVMAVLNTNFWLGTHVICITSGYAAAVITSLYAHYALWRGIPAKRLKLIVIIALLLTAVGTLLGGIWADQSWGRFWGWDPKENGAMLIVLWLIWLIHARLVGQISERWYLAGLCYLSVTVALAWFGVNLLSVGLHSYGFLEGTAMGLFIFIALETCITAWLLWRSRGATHA